MKSTPKEKNTNKQNTFHRLVLQKVHHHLQHVKLKYKHFHLNKHLDAKIHQRISTLEETKRKKKKKNQKFKLKWNEI
jgi:hypothetical protein